MFRKSRIYDGFEGSSLRTSNSWTSIEYTMPMHSKRDNDDPSVNSSNEQTQVGFVHRFFREEPGERRTLILCGLCFFFLLFGYFLLRPLREAMGVQRSMGDLRWLFLVTCAVSLGVTLAFGGVVSRFDRRRFIPIAFRAVMACLVVFMILQMQLGEQVRLYAGYVFYVWLSVINLFMMSVFWAFMADIWSLPQGKRLFATIGVGGTLGAFLGSNFVWWLADQVQPWMQMGIALVMFELCVQTVRLIDRRSHQHSNDHECSNQESLSQSTNPLIVGGSWIDGLRAIVGSPYLLGIGFYIVILAVSNTLLYFTQAGLVVDAADELSKRISLFAQLDMWTQLATLMVQLFVTAHLIKRIGIGITLAILPFVTVVGFVALAWIEKRPGVESWQIFAVFAAFNATHRATRYAIIRPARETLFSVVPKSEKYKAKPIVDVFLYRGGDVAGAGVEQAIAMAGFGLIGIAMTAAPLAVLWGGLSIMLATTQHRKAMHQAAGLSDQHQTHSYTHSTGRGSSTTLESTS
jgi:ATP:ADP antiporter, AAA family